MNTNINNKIEFKSTKQLTKIIDSNGVCKGGVFE